MGNSISFGDQASVDFARLTQDPDCSTATLYGGRAAFGRAVDDLRGTLEDVQDKLAVVPGSPDDAALSEFITIACAPRAKAAAWRSTSASHSGDPGGASAPAKVVVFLPCGNGLTAAGIARNAEELAGAKSPPHGHLPASVVVVVWAAAGSSLPPGAETALRALPPTHVVVAGGGVGPAATPGGGELTLLHTGGDAISTRHAPGVAALVREYDDTLPLVLVSGLRVGSAADARVANTVGVDAAVCDWELAATDLPAAVQLVGQCNFACLLTNVGRAGNVLAASPAPYFGTVPFKVLRRSGSRVGVIGLVDEAWFARAAALRRHDPAAVHTDYVTAALGASKILREQHRCDVVVALTSMSRKAETELARECGMSLDIVLAYGGATKYSVRPVQHDGSKTAASHAYTLLARPGPPGDATGAVMNALTVHVGAAGQLVPRSVRLGESADELQRRAAVFRSDRVTTVLRARAAAERRSPDDAAVASACRDVEEKAADGTSLAIGTLGAPLDARAQVLHTVEAGAGLMVADVLRAHCGSQCAIVSGGTIVADREFAAGPLGATDVAGLMRADDRVVCVVTDGARLLAAMEHGFRAAPVASPAFVHSSGLSCVLDLDGADGRRVTDLLVGGEPVGPGTRVTVATTAHALAQYPPLVGAPFTGDGTAEPDECPFANAVVASFFRQSAFARMVGPAAVAAMPGVFHELIGLSGADFAPPRWPSGDPRIRVTELSAEARAAANAAAEAAGKKRAAKAAKKAAKKEKEQMRRTLKSEKRKKHAERAAKDIVEKERSSARKYGGYGTA